MKNWLQRKIANVINYGPVVTQTIGRQIGGNSMSNLENNNNPMQFNLYNAGGGKVLEVKYYQRSNDEYVSNLHVISSDEDLGAAIGKIIFIESLKRN